jgi:hypothetical protein
MQHLEVSGAVRPIYGSLGVKRLKLFPYPQGQVLPTALLYICIFILLTETSAVHQLTRRISTNYRPNTHLTPVPVATRSKAWVCGRSLAGIVGSNPAGGMDVFLCWVLCVVR